jgi:uncharacterized protein (DUF1778 family)
MVEKTHRLNVRITDEEWKMLKAMADAKGISASDFIRMFIRETYEAFLKKKR